MTVSPTIKCINTILMNLSSFELIETMLNLYLNALMAVVGILYIRIKNLLLKAKLYGKY
jgi:hypothetical protein